MTAAHMVLIGAQLFATVILASPVTTDSSSINLQAPHITSPPRLHQAFRREASQGEGDACGYVSGSFRMLFRGRASELYIDYSCLTAPSVADHLRIALYMRH